MPQKSLLDFFGVGILFGEGDRKSFFLEEERVDSPALPTDEGNTNPSLMEKILHPDNLEIAWKKVKSNKGAPGVDGVTIKEFPSWRDRHWSSIAEKIRIGKYKPYPVRRVEIPKPDGGVRLLGIPTVLDRFIQQAVLQVLQPLIDPTFSDHSYGFRPGRSAHDAIRQAKAYVKAGYSIVIDIDLEKFFDRVNHDILMSRVAKLVADKQVLRLLRRYLQADIMAEGVHVESTEGVPQGGPLSPLLANILLDVWDKELERRGHRFVRYADDCTIFVRSMRAGDRVFKGMTKFLKRRLKLRVNRDKSAVGHPDERSFLGFTICRNEEEDRWELHISPKAIKRFRSKIRDKVVRRGRGQSLENTIKALNRILRGWCNYFGIVDNGTDLSSLDGWVRHRLRCIIWRRWKRPATRVRRLIALGISRKLAYMVGNCSIGPWRMSYNTVVNFALRNKFFHDDKGLLSLCRMWSEKHGSLDTF